MGKIVVSMKGIRKEFPGGVVANRCVDLDIKEGEIHALLGENGAGKSTLMNILTGLYAQDEGTLSINGEEIKGRFEPKDAIKRGIGMVHQNFRLVSTFTVAENMCVGETKGLFIKKKEVKSKLENITETFKLSIDIDAKIWQMSIGEQQRVEICKMLYKGAKILIMDEPTAVLTPQEVDSLFGILKEMTSRGVSIIFITHKMHEVLAFSDSITVLRDGEALKTIKTKDTNEEELAKLMVGRQLDTKRKITHHEFGENVLELKGVYANNDKNLKALDNVNLTIRKGEILGIAGVAGNGQRELSEVITGLRKFSEGSIEYLGEDIKNLSVRDLIDKKLAFIPEDRHGMGLANNLSVMDNSILKSYRREEYGKILLNKKKIGEDAQKMVDDFEIKIPNVRCPVKLMSGGNLQKLILARETALEPELIIAAYPIRGLDVGATEYIHDKLIYEREKGSGVLLISEDLEEIFKMTDRVAVFFEGRVMGVVDTEDISIEELGMMMAGSVREVSA